MSGDKTLTIAATDDHSLFKWSRLPKDVQRKVLAHMGIQALYQMRCVCREWRHVTHRRDFCTMYDTVNSSQSEPLRPAICYIETSYPARFEWSTYDYVAKSWKRMTSFPLPATQSNLGDELRQWDYNLYSVGGLLCLYHWKLPPGFELYDDHPPRGVSSWIVWHPFRNTWKQLPPCKYKVGGVAPFFAHAFVADEQTKAYKILMAHDPGRHSMHRPVHDDLQSLVTEVYDSATGVWTDGPAYTFRFSGAHQDYPQLGLVRRGVLCDHVVYFVTGGVDSSVLLFYDTRSDLWDEGRYDSRYPIFEWDGRLMSIMSIRTQYFFHEWDLATRKWKGTGIEVPWKILGKFRSYIDSGIEVVATGNDLALTGYKQDDSFRIAVYKRAENYWRLPPSGAFSENLERSRVQGLVLHSPRLEWRP